MEQVQAFLVNFTPVMWLDKTQEYSCKLCEKDPQTGERDKGLFGAISLVVIFFVASLVFKAAAAVYAFYKYYMQSQLVYSGLGAFEAKYKDKWVLVSGGSSGIGLALAKKFAERKLRLMILARSPEKLAAAKTALEAAGAAEVVTVSVDFDKLDEAELERVRRELSLDSREVGVLVNNVGVLSDAYCRWHMYKLAELRGQVNVNFVSALFLTSLVLPAMKKRGSGVIVNVSSAVVLASLPLVGAYAATKCALDRLAVDLNCEYPELSVVSLVPNAVRTPMFETLNKEFPLGSLLPDGDGYAASAFNIITSAAAGGCLVRTSGCLVHELANFAVALTDSLGLSKKFFTLLTKTSIEKLDAQGPAASKRTENGTDEETIELKTVETEP